MGRHLAWHESTTRCTWPPDAWFIWLAAALFFLYEYILRVAPASSRRISRSSSTSTREAWRRTWDVLLRLRPDATGRRCPA